MEKKLNKTSKYQYFIQGIYSIIDQFMSARPWDGGHWWLSLPFPVIYACFNVIYWAAGGTDYYVIIKSIV